MKYTSYVLYANSLLEYPFLLSICYNSKGDACFSKGGIMDYRKLLERKAAKARYAEEHICNFSLKLNDHTDQDILAWLAGLDNKQGTIKRLIRDEIQRLS